MAAILLRQMLTGSDTRQGLNVVAASGSFWVPNCFSAGMLLQKDEKFFMATGRTPGILYVSWLFCCFDFFELCLLPIIQPQNGAWREDDSDGKGEQGRLIRIGFQ